jgi:hypothetical protein
MHHRFLYLASKSKNWTQQFLSPWIKNETIFQVVGLENFWFLKTSVQFWLDLGLELNAVASVLATSAERNSEVNEESS